MSYPVYHVPAGDILPIVFATYAGTTGASVTLTGLAITDVEVYKDVSMTQRASDAGVVLIDTDGIDIDGITGIHGFSIDTGDNTDAGFYTVGAWFTVVVSAVTVDAQTVNFVAAQFRLMPAEAVAGKPKVDVDAWLGTAAATPTVAGVPEVDVTHYGGSAGTFASGVPAVNMLQISGDGTAADNLETALDDTAGPVPWFGITDQGTAQSASATGVVLRSAAAFADDTLIGCMISALGSTQGYWQHRVITDNALSGDTVTVDTWTVTPSGTITYKIWGAPPVASNAAVSIVAGGITNASFAADAITAAKLHADVTTELQAGLATAAALATVDGIVDDILLDTAEIGTAGAGLTNINLPNQTMDIVGNITGNLSGSVGTVTTVNGLAANVITAAATAADFTTEIQAGLATAAALATVDGLVDTLIAAVINLATTTGAVTTDAGNSATAFETNLAQTVNDYWKDSFLLLTSGALVGQQKKITAYNGTTKIITVAGGFTGTPADGVTFAIVNR